MIDTNNRPKYTQGFTLVELMVSITIMIGMTALLLSKYPDTAVKITLANANSELSRLIREVQLRGSSVDSSDNAVGGYGIFFDRAKPRDVIMFGDNVDFSIASVQGLNVGDGLYNTTPDDEMKLIRKLPEYYSYKKLCVASSTASVLLAPRGFLCNATSTPEIHTLTISFTRPSQIAHIYINGASTTNFASACIQTYSPKSPAIGHIRSLKVYHSGMVTLTATSCD